MKANPNPDQIVDVVTLPSGHDVRFLKRQPEDAIECTCVVAQDPVMYGNLAIPCEHVIEAIKHGYDAVVMDASTVLVPLVREVNLPGGKVPFSVAVLLTPADKAGVRAAYFDSEFMNTRLGYVVKGDGRRALRNLIIPALDAAREWGLPNCNGAYHDRTFSAMLNQAGERAAILAETYALAVHGYCAHCHFVGEVAPDLIPTV